MRQWLFVGFLLLLQLGKSQFTTTQTFLEGQGGAGVADVTHTFIDANPSVSAWIQHPTIIAGYYARFFMHELSDRTLSFIYPLPQNLGTSSIQLFQSGFSALYTTGAKLNFARAFGDKFSMGLNFDYFLLGTNDEYYGKKHLFILESGSQYRLNTKLSIGTYIFNPVQPTISTMTNERLPSKIVVGSTYYFSDKMLMSADVSKIINHPISAHLGFRFMLNSRIRLMTGTSINPFQWHMGTMFVLNKFQLIWALRYHNILSFSSGINLVYTFGKKVNVPQTSEQ